MELFYLFEPPNIKCDLEVLRSSLKKTVGGNYEASTNDQIVHFLLSVLATSSPYLKTLVYRIEREMFTQRLTNISLASLRNHLCSYVDYLQSNVLQRKLPGSARKTLLIIVFVLKTLEPRLVHVFDDEHSEECHFSKLLLPFTFPRDLVSKRAVEVTGGKAYVYCGVWKSLMAEAFNHLLDIEYLLLANNKSVMRAIFDGEDDRVRRLVQECVEFLGGQSVATFPLTLDNIDNDSRYFPPCMANLHQILRRTHRLSYDSRYQYTVFLKDAGLSVDDNTAFWENEYNKQSVGASCCHDWKQKETRYKYQIKHIYGLVGDTAVKFCRGCDHFIDKLSSKMNGGCPFQHSRPAELERSIPHQLNHVAKSILDLQAQGEPKRACALYLSSQKPIPGIKSIVSPIQYYNLARSLKK